MNFGIDLCNTLADVNLVLDRHLGKRPDEHILYHPALKDDVSFFKRNLWVFSDAPVIEGALDMVNKFE